MEIGNSMRLAIASGKGGTGKTTVATCLASLLAESGQKVTYIDCDAEEPNGHLILNPVIGEIRSVDVNVVSVDEKVCTGCGKCCRACQFHALACVGESVTTFPQLCHSCGACALVCPADAIVEIPQRRVQHFEEEHRLGSAGDAAQSETAVRPVLRARGATFAPAKQAGSST